MSDSAGPLAGYRVAVTAERRREEIAASFERRGAEVTLAPSLRLIPLTDDHELRESTQTLIDVGVDDVVVTTGIGFRGWTEAADAWGVGDRLRRHLEEARIHSRGPKATGAIRSSGLREVWTAASESTTEVIDHLIDDGVEGRRVAFQMHGLPADEHVARLEEAGAKVLAVHVYRWEPPRDARPLDTLIADIGAGATDAVVFTSALGVAGLLDRAAALGRRDSVLEALRAMRPWACCVGPVTADALVKADVPVIVPNRSRLGDLIRRVSQELPERADRVCGIRGSVVVQRPCGVLVDGQYIPMPGGSMALFDKLADAQGGVVSRQRLLECLPDVATDTALDAAITRLRSRLPERDMVETVIKRGYRLACDPS